MLCVVCSVPSVGGGGSVPSLWNRGGIAHSIDGRGSALSVRDGGQRSLQLRVPALLQWVPALPSVGVSDPFSG